MRCPASLCAALALAGCSGLSAHDARTALVGVNQNSLISMIGIPTERIRLDPHDAVFDYDFQNNNSLFSLTVLTLGTASLGAEGECLATFHLHDGIVDHVAYSRTTSSLAGPLAACGALVSQAVKHPYRAPLSADDNPMAIVAEPK